MLKITKSKSQPRKPAELISIFDRVEELDGTDAEAGRRFEPQLKNAKEAIENDGPLPPAVAKGFIAAHQCLSHLCEQIAEIVLADAMARIARDEEKRSPSANANDDLQSPVPTETDET